MNSSHRIPGIVLIMIIVLMPEASAQDSGSGTGSVRGTVELPAAGFTARRQRGMRYRGTISEAPEPSNDAEAMNVVVYLEGRGLPGGGGNKVHVLDQRNTTFVPHVLPIIKGETVRITNQDKTYHNVFSLSGPKKFNIGRRPTGEAVPVQFEKEGVVQVFCDIHSHMTAFVVVLGNRFFAQPERNGSFVIGGIPPGSYRINVWHERYAAEPQEITIRAGEATSAEFLLQ